MEEVDAAGAALAPGKPQSRVLSVVLFAEGAAEGEPTAGDSDAREGEVAETAAPAVEATLWVAASEAEEEVSGDWPSSRADVGVMAGSGVEAASAALWGHAGDAAAAPSAASSDNTKQRGVAFCAVWHLKTRVAGVAKPCVREGDLGMMVFVACFAPWIFRTVPHVFG